LWQFPISSLGTETILAVEIFARAFDESGARVGQISLPYSGVSSVNEALFGVTQTKSIETANWMSDTGSSDPAALTIALVGIHDSETDTYQSFLEHELPQLWKILERTDLLVGYNSDHFDIPLLNKYYSGDLSKIKSLDILGEIKNSYGRRMKLDQVAEATLGSKKTSNGLQATVWWKQGEREKVRDYCIADVKITKEVYDYAIQNKMLKYKEGGLSASIPLEVSSWETKDGNSMTYSLPF